MRLTARTKLGRMKRLIGSAGFWITIVVIAIIGGTIYVSHSNWPWLKSGRIPASTIIHDISFVVGGTIAILLALWRGRIAERQSKTAQLSLLNERYQKGAEMLGSGMLSVQLGGIYALLRLARQHPNDYHTQIMSLLCAFVRNLPPAKKASEKNKYTYTRREEVLVIVEAIAGRDEAQINAENKEKYDLDLNGTDLAGARLVHAYLHRANLAQTDLTGAHLDGAKLVKAWLAGAKLTGAELTGADLSGASLFRATLTYGTLTGAELNETRLKQADLTGADLSGATLTGASLMSATLTEADLSEAKLHRANLYRANLTGVDLTGATLAGADLTRATLKNCTGLTQDELDQTFVRDDFLPNLTGAYDAKTGKPLVWSGQSSL